jgi:hypothetical protein
MWSARALSLSRSSPPGLVRPGIPPHADTAALAPALFRWVQAASVARDLIKQGANVNAVSGWTQMTPLHIAAFYSSTSVLEVLGKEGPNVDMNVPCSRLDNYTPLHMAATAGSPDAVEMLLEFGSDPTLVDVTGMTPLACVDMVAAAPDNTTPEETWNHIKGQLTAAMTRHRKGGNGNGGKGTRPPMSTSTNQRSQILKTQSYTIDPKASSTPTRSASARTASQIPNRTGSARSNPGTPNSSNRSSLGGMLNIGDRVEANGKVGLIR